MHDYFKKCGKFHRENGPAIIKYYEDGSIFRQAYHVDGEPHRVNDPAYIEYFSNKQVSYESYFFCGIRHRGGGGPAIIFYNKEGSIIEKEYYVAGKKFLEKAQS